MSNTYLSMLAELGIEVSPDEWNSAHNVPNDPAPRSPPLLPSEPAYYDSDDDHLPIFTSSQIAWCDPEPFGYHRYCVVEDEETAHPMVMDYQDEQQWKMNRQRTHHYDRLYRIRRTFFQLLGHATTKLPPTLESDLKKHIHGSLLMSRNIYEVIRKYLKQRKLPHLYPAIPLLISRLGGPRWNVPYHKVQLVLEDAFQLHRTFDYLKKQGSLGRQRFPKVQYVVLMLLHRHTILPPYRIPWARTSIKRKQLSQLLSNMKEQNPVLQWANDKPKTDQTTR
ncbi:hypothetical protein BC832DRAFT_542167 [Gaertneriomyces semiglobifer]|nr:hypothetical protein BC832DRAFT_542167 [Gaertneriomyces semiglobifer]